MELTTKQKAAFGIGAVGKDMVYALSASYVMYYYQDVLGLPATFVGLILMIARVFDAFNDPFMGVLVAKTRTRWGRFRPWILSGTVLNAVVLYALFAAPVLEGADMMVYFSVIYILWGVTYTMMDIPYWSMIPAVTRTPADRENLSVVGRTCAGVGSALIAMFTMLLVGALGGDSERTGFRWVALLVAVIFVVTEAICCASVKETGSAEIKTATVGEMFKALFSNDQALVVVGSIVLDQLGAVSDLQLYHLFLQVRFRRHRLEGQLHAVLNHRRCGTDPRHDGPLSGAAQKAQQHCRIYGKSGVGAGRLCCAAPALPDGLFRQSGTALRAGRGGLCLQRHAQRTDDPFPLQQCGLRPAQDRAP